jgi:glycine/D-amino acid oxidase-like deaminating enzyme
VATSPSGPVDYRRLSLWHETADDDWTPRAPLDGSTEADVVVVGAGFTGLWTAYYLARAEPGLRILVLEREVAGFGASGRNGGWCSALFPASAATIARRADADRASGRDAAVRMLAAMRDTVGEVGRVLAAEGIEAHWQQGGTLSLARSAVQLRRLRAEVAEARNWGVGADDLRLLDAAEAAAACAASGVRGAMFTPHCAVVHPARLVRGLARAVERLGVRICEQTPVTAIRPWQVDTPAGRVRAEVVVRATEGYTPALTGERRTLAPVYSLMVATEPVDDEVWSRIGLHRRESLTDARHMIIYAQRTADGRLAFGGRGAPYHFGSAVRPEYDSEPRVFAKLEATVRDLFPALADTAFSHRWGGVLGVPRDWHASVGLDKATGLAWGGGYVGDGVGTSNLAGRTLADLVVGRQSPLVDLPWVGHRSRRWEPEPVRWAEVNGGLTAMTLADVEERVTRRPSLLAKAMAPFLGGH